MAFNRPLERIELPKESLAALIIFVLKKDLKLFRVCLAKLATKVHLGLQKAVKHHCALSDVNVSAIGHNLLEDSRQYFLHLWCAFEE